MTNNNGVNHWDLEFTDMDDRNILASASTPDGRTILVMTAPASSIDGGDGPVLIASDLMTNIIVVYSDEYIDSLAPQDDEDMGMTIARLATVVHDGVSLGLNYINGCA